MSALPCMTYDHTSGGVDIIPPPTVDDLLERLDEAHADLAANDAYVGAIRESLDEMAAQNRSYLSTLLRIANIARYATENPHFAAGALADIRTVALDTMTRNA